MSRREISRRFFCFKVNPYEMNQVHLHAQLNDMIGFHKYIKNVLAVFILANAFTSQTQTVKHETGIQFKFEEEEQTFPEYWYSEEINAQTTPLPNIEKKRSIFVLSSALDKYPKHIIQDHLIEVYIFGVLEFFQEGYAGTYSDQTLYLSNSGVSEGYTNGFIEQTFHHEFSSILWYAHPELLDTVAWKKLNKLDYGDGGIQALIDDNDSQTFDTYYNERGFLFQYASSDLENDINSFAENLFAPTLEFRNALKTHPVLRKKMALLIAFYGALDPSLNSSFFAELPLIEL
jgi:hypothetical protein